MQPNQTYRFGLLLILVGGFHALHFYGLLGDLGLVLVYLGGGMGVLSLIRSDS